MNQHSNKIATEGTTVEKIRTKLKFIKSEQNGALISFVSQNPVNGIVCGVRQDSPYPKKIVIIDRDIANEILVNVLYDCVIIPMTANEDGFVPGYIAIEAKPMQFKATIKTNYIPGVKYNVEVSFGNKVIRFDPFKGRKESLKSLPACRAVLEKRYDVKDLMEVVEGFDIAANNLLELMKNDRRKLNNRRR